MDLCQDHLVSIMTVNGLLHAFLKVFRVPISMSLSDSVTTLRLMRLRSSYLHIGML